MPIGRAFDGAPVGKVIGVVRDDLRIGRVGDARQPEVGRGMADIASRQVVVNGEDCVFGVKQIVDDDLAEWGEGRRKAGGDLGQLV